jgi:flagellar motility protein MotE (MotC chaperone)
VKIFRILPATIITAALLLCVKIVGMLHDTESLFISSVEAQQEKKPSNVSTEKPSNMPDQGGDAKKSEDKKNVDKKPDEKKADEKKTEDKKVDEKKSAEEGGEHKKEEKKDKENPNISKELESSTDHRFTAVEVELLQSLSKRREELDRWENNIQIKESALDATQKRIDDKIKQIEAMKKQVAMLLAQYNTQEDAKIHSLVKIYENMKPSEAARIFDEVEMPILLLVIDSMAEKKAAPILAAMDPKKAKQLTVELANERKINTKITTGAESQIASPPSPTAPESPPVSQPPATTSLPPAEAATPKPAPAQ